MIRLLYKYTCLIILIIFPTFDVLGYVPVKVDDTPELFAYMVREGNKNKFGFMNMAGEIIVPPIYTMLGNSDTQEFFAGPDSPCMGVFTCGLARVYDSDRGYGFIDYNGVEVVPCQYNQALPFNDGLAAVENNAGDWGYINTKGEIVVPLQYYAATMHREGYAFVGKRGSANQDINFAIVNNKGNVITDFIYQDIIGWPFFSEGIKIVKSKGKRIAIDTKGAKVFECQDIFDHYYFSEGVTSYSDISQKNISTSNQGNRYVSLIDKSGKTVLRTKYTEIRPFENGMTLVYGAKGYGAINRQFKEIIAPQYNKLYIDGEIFIAQNSAYKWGYLDKNGREIIPFIFDEAYHFRNEVACVKYNGKWGYINSIGEFVIPAIYDSAYDFDENGYAIVERGNMFTVIDIEQVPLIPYSSREVAIGKSNLLGRLNAKSDVDVHIPQIDKLNGNTIALIIANEKYSHPKVGNVMFAKNDGRVIKSYFISTLGIPEQNIMVIEDATLSQMKSGVGWLYQKSNITENTRAIIYYAGHGIPDYSTSKSYLLPSDGNPLDMNTSYSLEDFYTQLSKLNVNSCITLLDACFSGVDRRGEAISEVRGISIKPSEPSLNGNVVVISACKGDEIAQPFPEKHHGVFTYYFLKFLQKSKGQCSLLDLSEYLQSNVSNTTLNTTGKKQTPTIHFPKNKVETWKRWTLK